MWLARKRSMFGGILVSITSDEQETNFSIRSSKVPHHESCYRIFPATQNSSSGLAQKFAQCQPYWKFVDNHQILFTQTRPYDYKDEMIANVIQLW